MKAKAFLWLSGASFVLALVSLAAQSYGHAAIDVLLSGFFSLRALQS